MVTYVNKKWQRNIYLLVTENTHIQSANEFMLFSQTTDSDQITVSD